MCRNILVINFSCSGSIPLRQLVYRVLELPSSMQSLVYDFGQLDFDVEKDYAKNIVGKYVCLSVGCWFYLFNTGR